jgi:hypothetical protein
METPTMSTAIQLRTIVLPGHRIEVSVPELPEGRKATVFVVLDEGEPEKRPLREVLGDYKGGEVFQSGEQVDAYLKAERESWE